MWFFENFQGVVRERRLRNKNNNSIATRTMMEPNKRCHQSNKDSIRTLPSHSVAFMTRNSPMTTASVTTIRGFTPIEKSADQNQRMKTTLKSTIIPDSSLLFHNQTASFTSSELVSVSYETATVDEPNLYNIPITIYPTYQPLSNVMKVVLSSLSTVASIFSTWPQLINLQSIMVIRWVSLLTRIRHPLDTKELASRVPWRKLAHCIIQACVFTLLSRASWQELFLPPSRVTTNDLAQKFYLPSKLSVCQPVKVKKFDEKSSKNMIDVHWLEYESGGIEDTMPNTTIPSFDVVYCNHGFGASSLSWLPILPKLTDLVRASIGLGHDAVGFGFTERPGLKNRDFDNHESYLDYYTMDTSAEIGTELLMSNYRNVKKGNSKDSLDPILTRTEDTDTHRVLLVGHSMGSLTTLRMALKLCNEWKSHGQGKKLSITIVLVAPALGLSGTHELAKEVSNSFRRSVRQILGKRIVYPVIDRCSRYILRRLVGTPNFWRKGLSLAWGNKDDLSSTDVLRYQWPSIGYGWEQGLLNFAKAQTRSCKKMKPFDEDCPKTDRSLLEAVLAKHEVENVHVFRGKLDQIVRGNVLNAFFADFPSIEVKELDGLGHNPFEEDVETFLDSVSAALIQ